MAIIEWLRAHKIAGATATRGIAGYGATSHLHTANILRLSMDMPIAISVIDTPETIDSIIEPLGAMAPNAMFTVTRRRSGANRASASCARANESEGAARRICDGDLVGWFGRIPRRQRALSFGRVHFGAMGRGVPLGTFVINVTGSFILGFFMAYAQERPWVAPGARLMFAVGFVGAYTTFSTFEYETMRLIQQRELLLATWNIFGSLLSGAIAVFAGIVLGGSI